MYMKKAIKLLVVSLASLFLAAPVFSQVTTSSMSGKITDDLGPVVGAAVVAVHQPTGSEFYAITDPNGRYVISSITAGGPYKVTVSCLGYHDFVFTGIEVALSDNAVLNANSWKSQ